MGDEVKEVNEEEAEAGLEDGVEVDDGVAVDNEDDRLERGD